MRWQEQAACRGLDPDLFIHYRGAHYAHKAASQICARCPVREKCLEFALKDSQMVGTWAGTTARQRQRIAAGRPEIIRRQSVAKCGTDSGYHRHRRLGEPTCVPCRDAHSAVERRRLQVKSRRRKERAAS